MLKVCKKCGSYLERKIPFPLCDGTHRTQEMIVPVMCKCQIDEHEKREKKWQFDQKMIEISKLRNMSLMDNNLKNVRFDDLKITEHNEKQIKICRNYADKFEEVYNGKQGLLLYGDVGTGKTYLSACIANQLMVEKQYPVIMTSFSKMISHMATYKDENIMEKLSNVKLVIIDDFGIERSTDFAFEKIYEIVNTVYDKGIPLIVTTNISFADMKNADDLKLKRLYDRFFERCYPVKFQGLSFRKQKALSNYKKMKQLLEE